MEIPDMAHGKLEFSDTISEDLPKNPKFWKHLNETVSWPKWKLGLFGLLIVLIAMLLTIILVLLSAPSIPTPDSKIINSSAEKLESTKAGALAIENVEPKQQDKQTSNATTLAAEKIVQPALKPIVNDNCQPNYELSSYPNKTSVSGNLLNVNFRGWFVFPAGEFEFKDRKLVMPLDLKKVNRTMSESGEKLATLEFECAKIQLSEPASGILSLYVNLGRSYRGVSSCHVERVTKPGNSSCKNKFTQQEIGEIRIENLDLDWRKEPKTDVNNNNNNNNNLWSPRSTSGLSNRLTLMAL